MADQTGWTLGRVWDSLRKFWWLIAGLAVLGGISGYAYSASITPTYQSTASLYFSLNQGTSGSDLNQGATYAQNQMLSFARLAVSSRVLEPVIDDLDLDLTPRELAEDVQISVPQDTVTLNVTTTSPDPQRAADISNSISTALTEAVEDVAARGVDDKPTIAAWVIDDAVAPLVQSAPNKTRDAVVWAGCGFLLGALLAFLAALVDTRVRNAEAVAAVTDLPVLGSIARTERGVETGLIVAREPRSHTAEDFRRLQAALSFSRAGDGGVRRLLITSASPGVGTSTVSANLAVVLSDLGERTILIDADLRHPGIDRTFGVDGSVGVSTVVSGQSEFGDAVMTWAEHGPDLLASGSLPPNPSVLLTSPAFGRLVSEAAEGHDVVVIDTPPVLTVADTNLIIGLADSVILVVDASKTRQRQLANALRTLESSGANIIGVVLNKVSPPRDQKQYYRDAQRRAEATVDREESAEGAGAGGAAEAGDDGASLSDDVSAEEATVASGGDVPAEATRPARAPETGKNPWTKQSSKAKKRR